MYTFATVVIIFIISIIVAGIDIVQIVAASRVRNIFTIGWSNLFQRSIIMLCSHATRNAKSMYDQWEIDI